MPVSSETVCARFDRAPSQGHSVLLRSTQGPTSAFARTIHTGRQRAPRRPRRRGVLGHHPVISDDCRAHRSPLFPTTSSGTAFDPQPLRAHSEPSEARGSEAQLRSAYSGITRCSEDVTPAAGAIPFSSAARRDHRPRTPFRAASGHATSRTRRPHSSLYWNRSAC